MKSGKSATLTVLPYGNFNDLARTLGTKKLDDILQPRRQLEEKLVNSSVILDIEPNGAFQVKKAWPEAVLIFVAPPSAQELERRLRGRGDTGEEQIALRLARSHWELEQSKKYDHIVINDRVDTCADEILKIIAKAAD